MAVAEASSPPLDILVREPEGFSLWSGPPSNKGQPDIKLERVPCTSTIFTEDGSKLMAIKSDSVITIYDTKTWKEIRSFEVPSLLGAVLSPRGTYLQTFQKPSSSQDKNVNLWKIDTGVSVYQLSQKNMTKMTWPSIRFSSDEAVACRMVTNEIQFFDDDFSKGYSKRLKIPGVAAFELSRNPGSHVAAYVSETKGIPASILIYACAKDLQTQPVARRSFFRSSSVQLDWSNGSNGLLALVQSDDDKTNQSYYGESKLHYLTIDGSHEGLVPLNKDGPVHDARWSSSGSEFAVVYGFMPAKATIFNRKCNPILELGTGSYNTVRWNPKGKFLCLAGFGNLPGDMSFWDYSEKKLIGATKAEWSVTSEWSPDGRYFLTATTAPRLQVDNRIKIFHHNGKLIFKKNFPKLYQAEWKPESADKFGDIAELVMSLDSLKVEDSKAQGSQPSQPSNKPTTVKAPSIHKPAAYRPPHAKAADAVQDQLFGRSSTPEMSKNALRNKKKREKAREKKAAEGSSDT